MLEQLSTAILIENECSRKIINWDLLDINVEIDLPGIVLNYLDNWYLAGGAVCDLYRGKKPNDYDLFYVNDDCDAAVQLQNLLQMLRKNKHYETANCISIKDAGYKIQFIKRVYRAPDQVVGGFDMEPCKFIYKTHMQCTRGALLSCKYKFNPINLCAQSKSFTTRITKYRRKGFKPHNIWDMKGKFRYTQLTRKSSDYAELNLRHDRYIVYNNLYCMMSGAYDKLYSNGEIITPEQFRHCYSKKIKQKIIFTGTEFLNRAQQLFLFKTDEKLQEIITAEDKKHSQNIREIIDEFLKKNDITNQFYEKYKELFHVMISNVHTQYTNSFNPTTYFFYYFCHEYVPLKLYKNITIMCILRCTLPKPLRYMILKYWAQTHLIVD
jgi:hypothetical protein